MAKTLAQKIAVMQAAERGEMIEYRLYGTPNWKMLFLNHADWDWAEFDYRVKPKPQKFWVIFNQQNRMLYAGEVKPNIHLYKDCVLEEYERPSK